MIFLTVSIYHIIPVMGEMSRLNTRIPPKPAITPMRTPSRKAYSGDLLSKYFIANCMSKSTEGMIKNAQETTIIIDATRYASGIKVGSRRYSKTADPASVMQIVKTINNCFILLIGFSLQIFSWYNSPIYSRLPLLLYHKNRRNASSGRRSWSAARLKQFPLCGTGIRRLCGYINYIKI